MVLLGLVICTMTQKLQNVSSTTKCYSPASHELLALEAL
jgi:hypothetical protein